MMYIFGVKRHTSATVALRLMEIHRVVICTCKRKKTLNVTIEIFLVFWVFFWSYFLETDDKNSCVETKRNAQDCDMHLV